MPNTAPGGNEHNHTAPVVNVPAAFVDSKTGAVFVHEDLKLVFKPYEYEDHIEPPTAHERLGDVASWVAYVQRFAAQSPFEPLLTYSQRELHAVLDYHADTTQGGRCDWHASMPFVRSRQWLAWTELANGQAKTHQQMVEFLEDHMDDIVSPVQGVLMNVLRGLKVVSNTTVDIRRNEDGTQTVTATGDQRLTHNQGDIALPATIRISIQVLKGDKLPDGRPLVSELDVRLRAAVSKDGIPSFRFAMPQSDVVLEQVIDERVQEAQSRLRDGLTLLRAVD